MLQSNESRPARSLDRTRPLGGRAFGALSLAVLAATGCGGAGGDDPNAMELLRVDNGFGALLPHTIQQLNSEGEITEEVISIRSLQTLYDNVQIDPPNLVKEVPKWEPQAVLTNGSPGNHFITATFTQPIDASSVLLPNPGGSVSSNLAGAITLTSVDPINGETQSIVGRAFIDGKTFDGTDPETGLLQFTQWVELGEGADGQLKPVPVVGEAFGFPGTQDASGFPGSANLVSPNTLVFVVDTDNDLTTHETFPAGRQIRMQITKGVRSVLGKALKEQGLASSTVGPDTIRPEVVQVPSGISTVPQIVPGNGAVNVDPQTGIRIAFTESIQPTTVGSLDDGTPPLVSSTIKITFGPPENLTDVPFTVRPVSPYNLSELEILPIFAFPGIGSPELPCDKFSTVDLQISAGQAADLATNVNAQTISTFFETGAGEAVVNAPVLPDAIYVGRPGSDPAISVVDLNGFGGGTGVPTYDTDNPILEGNSNFPNNPNVATQGGLLSPALVEGTCTYNGGSSGVFTVTQDSLLNTKLISSPDIESVGDMAVGQPLDVAFNNGPPPFGCLSGNPNLCADNGLKLPTPIITGVFSLAPAAAFQAGQNPPGGGNLISWAPHPNPPPFAFPPLCASPDIAGQEPTSVDNSAVAAAALGLPTYTNLLVPSGDPFGNPDLGIPPSGLLAKEQNCYFQGPSRPTTQITTCQTYQIRQQVGHFLYMIDRVRSEVVVINSNRFTVVDRIVIADPTSLAMSPNLDLLAVTERLANQVTFINVNPQSPTFHQVVKRTAVGLSPQGIAWQPDNEDILVCNEGSGSVSVISAINLEVRKEVQNDLSAPFEIALTPRQTTFGLNRNVYFAWIINRDGRVALFESGPDGPSGWGADQPVGQAPATFNAPKTLQPDHLFLQSGCWIVHEDPLDASTGQPTGIGGGAVTNVVIRSGTQGQIPLQQAGLVTFLSRQIEVGIKASIGEEVLTGVPVDIAFDNLNNLGGSIQPVGQFSAGVVTPANGKNLIRHTVGLLAGRATNGPRYIFLAVPNSDQAGGVVDVISLDQGLNRVDTNIFESGIQSVPVPNARILCDYFRQ